MAKRTMQEAIQAFIEERKPDLYTKDAPAEFADADVLGIAVSEWSEWDVTKIVDVAFNALHDANAHDLADLLDLLSQQDDDFVTALLEELGGSTPSEEDDDADEYAEHSMSEDE